MSLFLSHAKRDGVAVAEALRSSIQDHTRVRAFFDDTDLPLGRGFAPELEAAAGSDSAAMIAIVSDAYAARLWCRREIALARTPRPEAGHPACWSIRPLLVVDTLQAAPTRCIPELGNATVVRWQPERAMKVVDLLMLEVLLSSYHRLRARQVRPAPGRHVIAWSPDPTTLLALRREAGGPVEEVVHPGLTLSPSEHHTLAGLFPDLRLRTYEDVARGPAPSSTVADGRLVGLSMGFNGDLGALGLGREHVEEIVLRVARAIVEAGGRIAFGGRLASSGLTETLLTLVRTLRVDDDAPDAPDPAAPILSYQRWPSLPSQEKIATDVGISEYVLVECPVPAGELLADDPRVNSPERARQHALALTAMRRAMSVGGMSTSAGRAAPRLDARIIVGGSRTEFNGYLPGVLEEALYAIEEGQPVFVLGGFGGGAAVLTRALLDDPLQPELVPAFHRRGSEDFHRLEQALAPRGEAPVLEALYARLGSAVARLHADLAGGLRNGLDAEENRRLMTSDHAAEIVELLRLGLERLWGAPAAPTPDRAAPPRY